MSSRYLSLLLLAVACKPAPAPEATGSCPAEQVTEATCNTDPAGCPKATTTTLTVQGASLLGGALPGAGIVSAAVSSVSITPYDGAGHVLVASTVASHTVLADAPQDAPGVSSTSVVLLDLTIPSGDDPADIVSTSLMRTRDTSSGRPTGRRSHSAAAPFQTVSVPESENAAFVSAQLTDGTPLRLAAATAVVVEHPRDGLKLFGLRSAGPGMVTVTEPKDVDASLSINGINGGMPNRISMNVTVPKQTQGATFGEKVNAGLHAAGSALSQGASLRSAVDTDVFGPTRTVSATDSPVDLGGAELAEMRAVGAFRVGLVSSDTCPVSMSALPVVERSSDASCGVSIWQVEGEAKRLPLDNPDNTPIIKGAALLAATVIENLGEQPRIKVSVYDSLSKSVEEHVVSPFNGAYTVTTRTIVAPLANAPVAIDAQYDNGGALWLTFENAEGTFVHAGPSTALKVRDARQEATPFASLALFHAVEDTAIGLTTTARPRHVALFSGGANNALLVLAIHTDTSPATVDITEVEVDLQQKKTKKVRFKAGAELATKIN